MVNRKVNHRIRIRDKKTTNISKIQFKDIVEFKYTAKDIYDNNPLVFVLSTSGKILTGINIGYLKEYIVEKLLDETNPKKLKSWTLCSKAYRTYKKQNIISLKLVDYETRIAKKIRLTQEGNKTEQPDLPKKNPKGPGGND
tara:strand:+ start:72 stop:494 length:423 start_codon:yes stop_codon:yes gene_type:complete